MATYRGGVVWFDAAGQVRFQDAFAQEVLVGDPTADPALAELWQSGGSVEFCPAQNPELAVLASLYPVPDGKLLVLSDVTPLRRLESLQREFIANVSHELRTPLTAVRMAAESLQMGAISDERLKSKFLSNIQREADRLTRLVNELLVLANVDGGKMALQLSCFDPVELFQDVMSTMEHHAELNDIRLVGDFPDTLPCLEADRDRLQQILINLTDNAIKCNRPNGSVTLRAVADDEGLQIQVADTGIGIPAIDLPRIFERFFRVDKARSRVTGGTGLGLSIVKDLIEAHGGHIDVTSEIDVGTTFTIRLYYKART